MKKVWASRIAWSARAMLLVLPLSAAAEEVPATTPAEGATTAATADNGSATAPFTIGEIRFEGNTRTRERILRQEMVIREGDVVTSTDVEAARQAIMDLGLFEWVRAELEQGEQGTIVVFRMEEKFFILPVPLINGDPNTLDYSYGLEMRVDNLGGLNQRLKLKYEEEHSTSKETPFTQEGTVSWNYPRVEGTPYNLGISYRLKQEDFNLLDASGETTAQFHRNTTGADVGVSRWLNDTGPSRGWFGSMGINYQQQAYTLLSGTAEGPETSQAVSLTAGIGTSDVHDHRYYFTGRAYGWNGELGTSLLGSDYDFTRHLFYYRVYDHFNPKLNLNWQLRLGFADGEPFGNPAYSIGGFTTLRGYQDAIEGNALALSNLEYHHQVIRWPTLRYVWFLDMGNTYPTVGDMDPGKLEAGTGMGLRWRVQSLVDVTLSADVAYGFGPQETVFYLMTTGTF